MESLYPSKGLFLLNSTNRGGTFKVMPGWNRRRNNPRPSLRTFVVGETLNNVMKPGTCLLYPHNTFNKLTEDYVYNYNYNVHTYEGTKVLSYNSRALHVQRYVYCTSTRRAS